MTQGNWARHKLLARDGPGNGSTDNGNGRGPPGPALPITAPTAAGMYIFILFAVVKFDVV